MSKHSNKFSFLTDDEVISFIRTMTKELRELAEDRDFQPLMKGLTNAERIAKATKHIMVKAG